MPPGVLKDDLYLAYAHSQMNPQTWTKVSANRSSRLTASPDFWMFDPLNPPPPSAPLCLSWQFVWPISIPRWICTCVPNVMPIGPAVCIFPWLLNLWPPNPPPPPNVEGRIVFSLCPFLDESADVYQIWCQSVQSFDSLPRLWDLWPPKTPRNAPLCIEVQLVWHISIPRWICTCVPNLVSIGPAVW